MIEVPIFGLYNMTIWWEVIKEQARGKFTATRHGECGQVDIEPDPFRLKLSEKGIITVMKQTPWAGYYHMSIVYSTLKTK